MKVPLYDHRRLTERWRPQIDAAIARVLGSGRPDWGEEVPAFEAEFARWTGAAHCVSVGSGTAGLKAALIALGIGPGDEVITVPNSDIATTSAIRFAGARIVWVDIDPTTRCIDTSRIEAAITPRTKAILPVDLYGQPADMPAILRIARKHGLRVVEDACLAIGAEIDSQRMGRFADVTCFSFAPTKHLGAIGSAGGCTTEDAALAERIGTVSAYGQPRERHRAGHSRHNTDGLNERMDEIQAAILRAKLPHLDETLAERRAQAERYEARLAGLGIDLPQSAPGTSHSWRNYVVELDNRDAVRARLTEAGIGTAQPYAPPLHLQPAYADLGHREGDFPVTERSCARLLCLPLGPHLTLEDVDTVAEALAEAI